MTGNLHIWFPLCNVDMGGIIDMMHHPVLDTYKLVIKEFRQPMRVEEVTQNLKKIMDKAGSTG